MAVVLGIGNATLDLVHLVESYPDENDEIRCLSRIQRRGGNAANTLVVLSELGHSCRWAGMLVDNAEGDLVAADLRLHGIDISASERSASGSMPVSSIILSKQNGSRTITHYRDLPEYSSTAFCAIDLEPLDWLHFEGRNVDGVRKMLERVRELSPAVRCSLEIEKPRDRIESLFPLADVLMFSRSYAGALGFSDPLALLQAVHADCSGADLFCAWGDAGAAALDSDGGEYRHPAVMPARVIDTLGAGDTFNAGIISGYMDALNIDAILARACRLAGSKCGRSGFDGLTLQAI
jgi:ketohexokinase